MLSLLSQRQWSTLATTRLVSQLRAPWDLSFGAPGARGGVAATAVTAIDRAEESEIEDWAEGWKTCLTLVLIVCSELGRLRTDLPQVMPIWLSKPVQICTLTKCHVISGDFRSRLMMKVKRAIDTQTTLSQLSVQPVRLKSGSAQTYNMPRTKTLLRASF